MKWFISCEKKKHEIWLSSTCYSAIQMASASWLSDDFFFYRHPTQWPNFTNNIDDLNCYQNWTEENEKKNWKKIALKKLLKKHSFSKHNDWHISAMQLRALGLHIGLFRMYRAWVSDQSENIKTNRLFHINQ